MIKFPPPSLISLPPFLPSFPSSSLFLSLSLSFAASFSLSACLFSVSQNCRYVLSQERERERRREEEQRLCNPNLVRVTANASTLKFSPRGLPLVLQLPLTAMRKPARPYIFHCLTGPPAINLLLFGERERDKTSGIYLRIYYSSLRALSGPGTSLRARSFVRSGRALSPEFAREFSRVRAGGQASEIPLTSRRRSRM